MLDDALVTFLQQGLAINLGTRNARLEPNAAWVTAARVDDDRRHLTIYVPVAGADAVLDDLRSNGQAALVFARPEDDRACQVKGEFVSAAPATEDDRALVMAQWQGFINQLSLVGMPGESSRPW